MTDTAAILRIKDNADELALRLRQWDARLPNRPSPRARQAANEAMDAIDAMLRDLGQVREALRGEVRQVDDASDARVDALLADHRAGRMTTPGQPAPHP